ncbi:hypothetical protein [Alteriqipengyuania lutimaris]|uniref:Uncharacterized protein n=1 Tax=Alteriqipengyuania lutimaris TaxID=1538146 RepID=A0A395LPR5_9SPHN|nr:hypothetical protein [Alteriqipengyuania lutimaris]MBB3034400.1 hypothetical protein [Alteriqipengyuania lutimaris]RDS76700.1 hypothetical protein DL238_03160 [Alteriqipengyuania lutimaris]
MTAEGISATGAGHFPINRWISMSKEESRRRRARRERRVKTLAKGSFIGVSVACLGLVAYLTL